MSNQQSSSKEISMAIRGYGALAAVSMSLLGKWNYTWNIRYLNIKKAVPLQEIMQQ